MVGLLPYPFAHCQLILMYCCQRQEDMQISSHEKPAGMKYTVQIRYGVAVITLVRPMSLVHLMCCTLIALVIVIVQGGLVLKFCYQRCENMHISDYEIYHAELHK